MLQPHSAGEEVWAPDPVLPDACSHRAIFPSCSMEGDGGDLLPLLSTSHSPGSHCDYDGQMVMGLATGYPP